MKPAAERCLRCGLLADRSVCFLFDSGALVVFALRLIQLTHAQATSESEPRIWARVLADVELAAIGILSVVGVAASCHVGIQLVAPLVLGRL